MDAAVLEQLLERETGDLAADAVKAREDHRARGVVDDEVDAGEHLERADVAPLAPDDPALQVVRLEGNDRDRRLVRVAAGEPLHAGREDAARAAVRLAPCLLLALAHELRAVVAQLVLQLAQQDLARLARAEVGDPLELAYVFALGGLQLVGGDVEVARAVFERGLAPGQVLQAHLDRLLLGDQPLLDAGDLRTPLAQLRVDLIPHHRAGGRIGDYGHRRRRFLCPGLPFARDRRGGYPERSRATARLPGEALATHE